MALPVLAVSPYHSPLRLGGVMKAAPTLITSMTLPSVSHLQSAQAERDTSKDAIKSVISVTPVAAAAAVMPTKAEMPATAGMKERAGMKVIVG